MGDKEELKFIVVVEEKEKLIYEVKMFEQESLKGIMMQESEVLNKMVEKNDKQKIVELVDKMK